MVVIESQQLSKSYDGKTEALSGLDLSIPEGSVFALLGPNGSGKTTTVRLLTGILTPTGGNIKIYGQSPSENIVQTHTNCGVMTETAQAYETMTAKENLSFFGQIHGLSSGETAKRTEQLLSFLDLVEACDRPVKTFSTGMKKRLLLAVALLHRPKILFLDEPTSGLDPEAAKNVNVLVKKLSEEENVTVFLCTHQLRYAEDICTLYGFLSKGRLIGFGTFQQLIQQKKNAVTLQIRGSGFPPELYPYQISSESFKIPIQGDQDVHQIISRIVKAGGVIFEARQEHMNLEDLYFEFQKEAAH